MNRLDRTSPSGEEPGFPYNICRPALHAWMQTSTFRPDSTLTMSATSPQFVPKYWNLVEHFRGRIGSGELKPGDRLPSYTEMRVQYGVSRPVTERVHGILERDGLILREAGRGIFVREPREIPLVIGFVGPMDNPHPYWVQVLEGVHSVAARTGIQVLLLTESSTVDWARIDGLILCQLNPSAWLDRLPHGLPCVVLLSPETSFSSVAADDRRATYDATNYLITQGHRHIGFLTSGIGPLTALRIAGYRAALKEAEIEFDPRWLHILPRTESRRFTEAGRKIMAEWLAQDWPNLGCTALLTQNDDTAMGVIQALRAAHIRVPEDVSVVGFDGTEISAFFTPPLTTLEVPLREISQLGTEMLLRHIAARNQGAETPAESLLVATKLVVRGSTGPSASIGNGV